MEQNTKLEVVDDGLIDFDGSDDPYRPLNWPFNKKVCRHPSLQSLHHGHDLG